MLKTVEVFSGSGNLSKHLALNGYSTTTIDKRKRKGVCVPDIRADFMDINVSSSLFSNLELLWFGLPCTAWSNASGDFHIDKNGNLRTDVARRSMLMLEKTITIIEKHKPRIYVIENPTGRLRYQKVLRTFLKLNYGHIHKITLGSYGFPTQKPTDIITNWFNFPIRPQLAYGRGAKAKGNFDNLTKNQRQTYPDLLCQDVASSLSAAHIL